MKPLFTILLFSLFSHLKAQQDAGNFYLFFIHPNFFNPAAQLSDSTIIINSTSTWKRGKAGYRNNHGGFSFPYTEEKINFGFNYFTSDDANYHLKEWGVFLSKNISLDKGFPIRVGVELGQRSQHYISLRRLSSVTFPRPTIVEERENSFLLNGGIILNGDDFFLGLSCRNCLKTGFEPNTSDTEDFKRRIIYLYGGFNKTINHVWDMRADVVSRSRFFNGIVDLSISNLFFDKYHMGISCRNEFPLDWGVQAGYKWKNYFLYGVFQPGNREDSAVFELAAQLEISKKIINEHSVFPR